jgi:excisionase family DNA binding protein
MQTNDSTTDILADGMLTVGAAAEFLSVGRTTIYGAMDSGQLAYVKIGRSRRIPRRALVAFAAANLTGGWNTTPPSQCGRILQVDTAKEVADGDCHDIARIKAPK